MLKFPVIKLILIFIFGIVFSEINGLVLNPLFFYLALGLLVLVVFLRSKVSKNIVNVIVIILIFTSGFLAHQVHLKNRVDILFPDKVIENISVSGKIDDLSLNSPLGFSFKLIADSVRFNKDKYPLRYALLIKATFPESQKRDSVYSILKIGYNVTIKGWMNNRTKLSNPGDFNYSEYLLDQGISGIVYCRDENDVTINNNNEALIKSYVLKIRQQIARVIQTNTDFQTSALLKSLILGDRSEIDYDIKETFIEAGVMHVLAISGLHVAFVIIIFLVLFNRVNFRLKNVLIILGLIFFLFISGGHISVLRAVIMTSVILLAITFNRDTNIYNSLAIAAGIILLINPNSLFDAGFQLSFAAVISIAYINPYFTRLIKKLKISNVNIVKALELFFVSLSAQIGTLPFIIFYFHKFSLIALLANLFVIPIIAVLIASSIVLIIAYIIIPSSSIYFGIAINSLVSVLYYLVNISSSLTFSSINVSGYNLVSLLIFYLFIFSFFYYFNRFSNSIPKIVLFIITVLNLLLFTDITRTLFFERSKLNILNLDVGQGDACIIQTPENRYLLVDGGDITNRFDTGKRIIIPQLNFHGIKKLDYALISHFDSDHFGGILALIKGKRVKHIIMPRIDSSIIKEVKLLNYIKNNQIEFSFYEPRILKTENMRFYFLNAPGISEKTSVNNRSGCFIMQYGKCSILFTGDIEKETESFLTDKYGDFLDVDILKVPHHGSKTSCSDKFLSYVKPRTAIISAGKRNRFKHPATETIQKLRRVNSKILRTDISGAILTVTDGDSIKVKGLN